MPLTLDTEILRKIGHAAVKDEDRKTKEPSEYKVVLLNDDYTPMNWVIELLEEHFAKPSEVAVDLMMEVHLLGRGVAGIYSKDIAETKAAIVNDLSRMRGYPLKTLTEPA
ncbi:MAG: ATP-dependent Clp protease adaptor ClpS [Gammaproteobacteria bacterium]